MRCKGTNTRKLLNNLIAIGSILLLMSGSSISEEKPDNILYDEWLINKTIWPKPILNSGDFEWHEHRQDLSGWPTLSYSDKRDSSKPEKVSLNGTLNGNAQRGKKLANNLVKGNCVACHQLPGASQFGNVGPSLELISYKNRDPNWLYQQVYDARMHNPESAMPPYGTHGVLSYQEMQDIVAYLQSK